MNTDLVVVYRRSDGVVEIVGPAPEVMDRLIGDGKTEAEAMEFIRDHALAKLHERGFGPASSVEILDKTLIPESQPGNRWFRDALEKPGAGVPTVNMPKARTIQARRINAARARAVAVLQTRANEATLEGRTAEATAAANDKAAVEGLNLTTIAAQIAAAADPTALSAIWPAELQEFKP